MRHLKRGRRLSRRSEERLALARNLVLGLVKQFGRENREYVVTTLAKAKEYRGFFERLITLGKKFNDAAAKPERKLALRRQALSMLPAPTAVKKIFEEIAPRYAERKGGYTRIVKTGSHRLGDGSQKVLFAFVSGLVPVGGGAPAETAATETASPEKAEKKVEKAAAGAK